ncbi:MAG TPA: hypothetical protein VNM89_07165 [Solirubrobacterales bacterium]|nr:hypothetical protein [Solirubrobacterales bacterium]
MSRLAAVLPIALLVLGIGVLPGAAPACACGEPQGFVVARGESLYGVPWLIKASPPRTDSLERRWVEFHFDMLPPAFFGVGYFKGMGFPIPEGFLFSIGSGSDLDPYPERELSGLTSRRVATLTVKMNDGPPMTFRPLLAPRPLRQRFPWLGRLRVFYWFFPSDLEPQLLTARDSGGRVLARRKSDRGSFFAFAH